jgi:hypothetical protein
MLLRFLVVVVLVNGASAGWLDDLSSRVSRQIKTAEQRAERYARNVAFDRVRDARRHLKGAVVLLEKLRRPLSLVAHRIASREQTAKELAELMCDNLLELRVARLVYPRVQQLLEASILAVLQQLAWSDAAPTLSMPVAARAHRELLKRLLPPSTCLATPPRLSYPSCFYKL